MAEGARRSAPPAQSVAERVDSEIAASTHALTTGDPATLVVTPDRSHRARHSVTAGVSVSTIAALLVGAILGATPWPSTLGVIAIVPAAAFDAVQHRLPDRLVAAAAIVFLVAVGAERIVMGPAATPGTGSLVIGAVTMALPLLLLHLVSPAAMGFGDVKAAVVLGAALGAVDPLLAWSALALAAGGAATYGILARRRTVPFGPALVGAAALSLLGHSFFLPTLVAS